jgi:urease accessory protein
MLVLSKILPPQASYDAELVLPFDLRQKSRLRTELDDGEEVGMFLERGRVLRDGDCLQAEDGRIVRIRSAAEKVLHVVCENDAQLVRVAYHLGNRHVALQVGEGWVRIAADQVLADMIIGLGASVTSLEVAFEPESGAYGGHHHHAHDADEHESARHGAHGHRGIIHQFGESGSEAVPGAPER